MVLYLGMHHLTECIRVSQTQRAFIRPGGRHPWIKKKPGEGVPNAVVLELGLHQFTKCIRVAQTQRALSDLEVSIPGWGPKKPGVRGATEGATEGAEGGTPLETPC